MSSFSFLTFTLEFWRRRCRIIKLKEISENFYFGLFFKSYDYFYEMNAFIYQNSKLSVNLCTLGTMALYSENLNFFIAKNIFSFSTILKRLQKICTLWGLRQTSDLKAAPVNDGHLTYSDTLILYSRFFLIPFVGTWVGIFLSKYTIIQFKLK